MVVLRINSQRSSVVFNGIGRLSGHSRHPAALRRLRRLILLTIIQPVRKDGFVSFGYRAYLRISENGLLCPGIFNDLAFFVYRQVRNLRAPLVRLIQDNGYGVVQRYSDAD